METFSYPWVTYKYRGVDEFCGYTPVFGDVAAMTNDGYGCFYHMEQNWQVYCLTICNVGYGKQGSWLDYVLSGPCLSYRVTKRGGPGCKKYIIDTIS